MLNCYRMLATIHYQDYALSLSHWTMGATHITCRTTPTTQPKTGSAKDRTMPRESKKKKQNI